MSALGQKPDIAARYVMSALPPKSGHVRWHLGMSVSGQKRTHAPQQQLFDHLVRLREYRWRNGQAERFRSLEIDNQLEFDRLLDWQFTGQLTFEDPPRVTTGEAIDIGDARSITDKPASCGKLAQIVNRRQ